MRTITQPILNLIADRTIKYGHLIKAVFDDETVYASDLYRPAVWGPLASAADATPNARDGTGVGEMAYGDPYFGASAGLFYGGAGAISIPTSPYVLNNDLTIEMFVRPFVYGNQAGSHQFAWYLANAAGGSGFGPEPEMHLGIVAADGRASFYATGDTVSPAWFTGAAINLTGGPDLVADGLWHHIGVTLDNTAGTATLWVDGAQVAQGTFSAGTLQLFFVNNSWLGRPDALAAPTTTSYRVFQGLVDDVRIWSLAREPLTVPTGELVGTESGLEAYYPLNDGPTYEPLGGFLTFEDLEDTAVLQARQIKLSMSGVDQQWIQDVLTKDYLDREIEIVRAYLDADGRLRPYPIHFFAGLMDKPEIEDSMSAGTSVVSVTATDEWAQWQTPNGRKTNNEEQQVYFPGDTFFRYVPDIGGPTQWGRQKRDDGQVSLRGRFTRFT